MASSSLLGSIVSGVANTASSAVSSAAKVASSGISAAASMGSSAASAASSLASSALKSASSLASSAVSTASSVASSAVSAASSIASATVGTTAGVFNSAVGLATSAAQTALDSVASVSNGVLGGAGALVQDTMSVASDLASGAISTAGELASNILGGASDTLASCAGGACSAASAAESAATSASTAAAAASAVVSSAVSSAVSACCASAMSSVTAACASAAASAQAAVNNACSQLNMVTDAMNTAAAQIATLNTAVGGLNGARDLLTATLQNLINNQVSKLCQKVVEYIDMAHGITHPLFTAVFQQTWDENRIWLPMLLPCMTIDEIMALPTPWMECLKEIPEYFDFIQKVMGGAIDDIVTQYADLLDDAVCTAKYATACAKSAKISASCKIKVTVPVQIPNLKVPLMSISKQIDDLFIKLTALKKLIMKKAKQILKKLKSLEAPDLYIAVPIDFQKIFSVLTEAEFIYNHLPIVIDKILEFFVNKYVEEFCKYADEIINKIFDIWKKVTDIVPPLQDLLDMCWAIPNQADVCFNLALNIALPNIESIIKPYIDMPFQCIQSISDACDAATRLAYAIPSK